MNRPEPKTQYLNEVPEIKKKKRGCWANIVEEFAERHEKCMTMGYDNHGRARAASVCIRNAITRNGLKMWVTQNDCTVYVIKEDGDETKTC